MQDMIDAATDQYISSDNLAVLAVDKKWQVSAEIG